MVQYQPELDLAFGALSHRGRRAMVERLGLGSAPISELAQLVGMTLTGARKHIQILEQAGLVSTEKQGRTRVCRVGPRRLGEELAWIENYRNQTDDRLDRLGELIEKRKGRNQ